MSFVALLVVGLFVVLCPVSGLKGAGLSCKKTISMTSESRSPSPCSGSDLEPEQVLPPSPPLRAVDEEFYRSSNAMLVNAELPLWHITIS